MTDNKNDLIQTPTKTPTKLPNNQKSTKNKKPKKSLGICFTIMPFSGWFQEYYKNIYKPAIEAVGLTPHRADDLYRPSSIVNDIWDYTRQAKLVLADLTGKNPNVFYELGLAHALAKPAILVAESIDDVPFDLRPLRVIEYDKNDSGWGKTLRTKIETAILEVLDAPLQAVLPTFLDVQPQKDRVSVSRQEKAMLEIRQELDLLRAQIRRRDLEPYRSGINPSRAADLINMYLGEGMPIGMIVDKLVARGVPGDWVIRKIEEMSPRKQTQLSLISNISSRSATAEKSSTKKKTSSNKQQVQKPKSKKNPAKKS
jgi:hypothetical protein